MPIRAVFLDYGGTLVLPDLDPFLPLRSILESAGQLISRQRYEEAERMAAAVVDPWRYQLIGKTPSYLDPANIELLRELGIPDADGRIVRRLHDVYTSPQWRPSYPGARETLDALRASKVPVFVVSNSSDMLLEAVARRGWSPYFQGVTFSQDVGAEKPDRRVFGLALAGAGCRASEVIHVGDSWKADYLGAMNAGIHALWLNREGFEPPEACAMIRDLRELPPLLEE